MTRAGVRGAIAAGLLLAAGCGRDLAHVFGGYGYDATLDCLDAPGVIDVIAGADPGMCPALRCWLAPDGTAYVTTEACDAPPDYKDETRATSGLCVAALAAYARDGGSRCPDDAGSTSPTDGP